MMVYRDDFYNKDSKEPGIAEIIVAKNRAGETGTAKLAWVGAHTSFENLAPDLKAMTDIFTLLPYGRNKKFIKFFNPTVAEVYYKSKVVDLTSGKFRIFC